MGRSVKSEKTINVRCFCGNAITVGRNARKSVVCSKCHQPLPMKAIKIAVRAREEEALHAHALAPGLVPSATL